MADTHELPFPVLDALPLGAHRLTALTDEGLFESCGVRVAFTQRDGGVSTGMFASLNCAPYVGDDERAVRSNVQIIGDAMGAAHAPVVYAHQVHGTRFLEVPAGATADEAQAIANQEGDGLLVGQTGVMAMLFSADCPLVVVVSPTGRFSLAHAGWRGAIAGIAGKAVELLAYDDACEPSCYNAYIGPHICADCFEVGPDIAQRFADAFGQSCVSNARHVSLAQAISIDLVRSGLNPDRVTCADACTKCNPDRFFSYRATNGECGRQCALAVTMGPR